MVLMLIKRLNTMFHLLYQGFLKINETPLHLAVQEGHADIVEALIKAKADVNAANCEGEGPIFTAVRWGRPDLIKLLAKNGANVNALNSNGLSPLEISIQYDSASSTQALTASNANSDVNSIEMDKLKALQERDPALSYRAPLVELSTAETPAITSRLVDESQFVRKTDENTAKLFELVQNNDFEELADLLNGNNVNNKVWDQETLLHAAVAYQSIQCIPILIEKGADVNAQLEITKEAPIHAAALNGSTEIIKQLVDSGAKLDIENVEGETPLFCAIRSGEQEAFQYILSLNVDIDHINSSGLTPVQLATMLHEPEEAMILIDKNANIDIGGNSYKIAQEANEFEIANAIRNKKPSLAKESPRKPKVEAVLPMRPASPPKAEKPAPIIAEEKKEPVKPIEIKPAPIIVEEKKEPVKPVEIKPAPIIVEEKKEPVKPVEIKPAPIIVEEKKEPVEIKPTPIITKPQPQEEVVQQPVKPQVVTQPVITPPQPAQTLPPKEVQFEPEQVQAPIPMEKQPVQQHANTMPITHIEVQSPRKPVPVSPRRHVSSSLELNQIFQYVATKNYSSLKQYLDRRLDLNVIDEKNGIPLIKAVEIGDLKIIQLLISAGADIDFYEKNTPLYTAIQLDKKDIAEYLLHCNANVELPNTEGETPIYAAIRTKNLPIVAKLVENGAEVNITNSNNLSPLYIAVGIRAIPIVKYLLNHHADPNKTGSNCLKLAQDLKDTQMINVLMTAGAKAQVRRSNPRRVQTVISQYKLPQVRPSTKSRHGRRIEDGSCVVCGAKNQMMKLVPCGHKVICKKCVDNFAEKYSQCPLCSMGFYATIPIYK